MVWTPVVLITKFKGYVIEVYQRMDDIGWGVRIFRSSYHIVSVAERRIDGISQIRAKKLGRKLVLKHKKLYKKKKGSRDE